MSACHAGANRAVRCGYAKGGGRFCGLWAVMAVVLVCLVMPARSWGQNGTGSQTFSTGLPIGPSPDAGGNLLKFDVSYTDANGKVKTQTVSVPNVPACQGLPYPTPAQVAAASAAKAAAIAKAINDAKIPGVSATVPMATVGVPYTVSRVIRAGIGSAPTLCEVTRIAQASQVTVTGVTPSVNRNGTPGEPVARTPGNNVTGEMGDGRQSFQQGNNPSTGTKMS